MTKLLGFILLLFAALVGSVQRLQERKRAYEALGALCVMLEQMRGILETQAPPMPELLQALSRCCDGIASRFVETLHASMDQLGTESFHALWRSALLDIAACLDKDIFAALESLGNVLGRYGLNIQLESISACLHAVRRRQAEMQQSLPRSRSLTLGISLSAAALLGIILS